jgi:hypothetical protein
MWMTLVKQSATNSIRTQNHRFNLLLNLMLYSVNEGKPMVVRNHLSMVAYNNIKGLAFGKRFMNANGNIDEEGREFKTIVNKGSRLVHLSPLLSLFGI